MDREGFNYFRIVLSIWLLGVCNVANAQELVPNGSFSYPESCQPGSITNGFMVEPWVQWSSSPDFYHPCKQEDYFVPNSFGGGGNPFEGEGYVGLVNYVSSFLAREFITVELLETMSDGISYHVEFYVSMMDSAWYATKNIGAHFSEGLPPLNISNLLELEPQVKYEGTDFLTEKIGWTKVEGSFTAEGGERYLTIGNFDIDEETDTLFVPGGGMPPPHSAVFWSQAHYYIDGVSVILDSIYLSIGDHEDVADSFNLYPNPNSGLFTVDIGLGDEDQAELHVWNISGQLVAQQGLSNGQSSISLDVSNGLYLYVVTINGERRWTGKVSVTSE